METFWIGVFAALLLGYFALEGFSIGVGVLLPFAGREESQRATIVAGLGPYFLGNEVWLVAVVGVLFGVFPTLEGSLLTGLFPLVVLFLLSWVTRDAGLWLRGRDERPAWRRCCDTAIFSGSCGMAAMWGMGIANIVLGIPSSPDSSGGLWALLNPYALLGAGTVAALLAAHGAAFLACRVDDTPGDTANRLGRWVAPLAGGMLLAGAAAAPMVATAPVPWLWFVPVLAVAVVGLFWARHLFTATHYRWAFRATLLGALAPPLLLLAGSLDVLRSTTADAQTLLILTASAGPVLPVLVLSQVWLWRTFTGTVDRATVSYL